MYSDLFHSRETPYITSPFKIKHTQTISRLKAKPTQVSRLRDFFNHFKRIEKKPTERSKTVWKDRDTSRWLSVSYKRYYCLLQVRVKRERSMNYQWYSEVSHVQLRTNCTGLFSYDMCWNIVFSCCVEINWV